MAGRADKYCYECAAVLPRTAVTCFSCNAEQPALPESAASAPARAAGAEKTCPSCGASILVQAEICVRCGVRQPAPVTPPVAAPSEPAASWDLSHAMLALGAMLVVVMAVMSRGTAPAPVASATPAAAPVVAADAMETEAWAAARRLVTTHLRAPPNVEFPSEHRTLKVGPDRYEVTSYFEMANTSGVMVRTNWTVEVARVRGEWRVERLEARN